MALSANVLIDANLWISYFDRSDSLYTKSGHYIQRLAKSNVLLLTDYVIQETITVFLYKNKPELIDDFLELINQEDYIEILSIDSPFLAEVLEFIKKNKITPKMSLTDWSLLFLAKEFQMELISFDKQLNNFYKRLVKQAVI